MPEEPGEQAAERKAKPGADAVEAAIGRIVASGALGQSERLEALLRYVVREELEGRGNRIKAYSIATDVLGRSENFNPSADSIVRVEFRRLRQALVHYYATTGADDALVINVPLGSYRPELTEKTASAPPPVAPKPSKRKWMMAAVLVLAIGLAFIALNGLPHLRNLTGADERKLDVVLDPVQWSTHDPALSDIASGLHAQLLANMTRFRFLSLFDGAAKTPKPPEAFTLKIRLQRSPTNVRMIAELVDPSGIQDWGQTYDVPADNPNRLQDMLTAKLLADLRPRIFIGARHFYDKMKTNPAPRSVWAAFIRATWVSGNQVTSLEWEKERIALARQALRTKPDFGPAHSLLAEKLSYLFAVDPPHDTPDNRKLAAMHASRALDLDSDDPDTVFNVALYRWHLGQAEDALVALNRTTELDPNHGLAKALIEPIKHFCIPVPQAEIEGIEQLDAELSPDNPYRWVVHSYLGDAHADNGDWDDAERMARESKQMLVSPDTFLRLALALQKNAKPIEAQVILAHQRENWPNLDLRHYARVSYTDRCGATPYADLRIRLLNELAALMEIP